MDFGMEVNLHCSATLSLQQQSSPYILPGTLVVGIFGFISLVSSVASRPISFLLAALWLLFI